MSNDENFDRKVAQKLKGLEEKERSVATRIAQLRRKAEMELSRKEQEHAELKSEFEELVDMLNKLSRSTHGRIGDVKLVDVRPKIKDELSQIGRLRNTLSEDDHVSFEVTNGSIDVVFLEKRKDSTAANNWSWTIRRNELKKQKAWKVNGADGHGNFDSFDVSTSKDLISVFVDRLSSVAAHEAYEAEKGSRQNAKEAQEERSKRARWEKALEPDRIKRRFSELRKLLSELPIRSTRGRVSVKEIGELPNLLLRILLPARKAAFWSREKFRQGDMEFEWEIRSLIDWDELGNELVGWELSEFVTDWEKLDEEEGVKLVTHTYSNATELAKYLQERLENELRRRER